MRVKICGIKRLEDIMYCNELLPDYIGFVFAASRRQITVHEAEYLRGYLHSRIKAVGVFVNEPVENIMAIARRGIIDLIQLHGQEDDAYIQLLKAETGLPVIKAYTESRYADFILFDGIQPGSGKVADWTKIKTKKPFFLAGGLTAYNVEEAMQLKPYAIDVSSGVELDGNKNYELMRDFIRRCRK